MADADVQITAGSGTKVDTRTVGAGTDEHRQVVVIGDPTTAADVAGVTGGALSVAIGPGANRGVGGTLGAQDAELEIDVAGAAIVTIAVTSSNLIGTVQFEETYDGSTWANGSFWYGSYVVEGGITNPSAGIVWRKYVEGVRRMRLRVSAYTSGTSDWTLTATPSGTLVIADSKRLAGASGIDVEVDDDAPGDNYTALNAMHTTAANMVFNGTTWDRLRGSAADGMLVNLGTNNDVTVTGTVTANAGTGPFPVSDNGGSLTVDGTVAVSGTVTVDSELPTAAAMADATANPTVPLVGSAGEVFNGTTWDRARSIGGLPAADANTGIQSVAVVPHKVGYALASATAQYTTTQTSTTLGPTVSASQRMVVTSIQIQAGGTVAGAVQVYFGTAAYTRGTTPAVFDGEFAPSATSKPGYAQSPPVPYMGATDAELRVTTSAAINPLTVTIWYYLVAV